VTFLFLYRLAMKQPLLLLLSLLAAAPAFAARAEDLREAKSVLEQAVAAHPGNAELRVHLAFVDQKLGDAAGAQREFEQAVKDDPTKAEARYMLGLLYEKQGAKDKALGEWKACLAAASDEGMKETAQRHIHLLEATKR